MPKKASKPAPKHDVCFDEDAVSQMKKELKDFLDGVKEDKADFYKDLFSRSIALVCFAVVLLFVCAAGDVGLLSFSALGPLSVLGIPALVLSIVLSVLGIILIVVIPTDKYNLDKWEKSSPLKYTAFRVVLAALVGAIGPVFFFLGVDAAGPLRRALFMALCVTFATWVARSIVIDVRHRKCTKTPCPDEPSLLLSDCLSGAIFFTLLLLSLYYLNSASYAYTSAVASNPSNLAGYYLQLNHYLYGAGYMATFIFLCGRRVCGYTKVDAFHRQVHEWRSRATLDSLVSLLFGISATFCLENLAISIAFESRNIVCDPTCKVLATLRYFTALEMAGKLATNFSSWFPVFFLAGSLHYDSVRTFLFRQVAELWGWEDVDKRQKAGAQLAAATNIQVSDWESNVYWVQRKIPDPSSRGKPECIQREFWMPGHIHECTLPAVCSTRTLKVRVYYVEDRASNWSAQFRGPRVLFVGGGATGTGRQFFDSLYSSRDSASIPRSTDPAVVEWRNRNFSLMASGFLPEIESDDATTLGPYVVVDNIVQESPVLRLAGFKEEWQYYVDWARKHFRSFSPGTSIKAVSGATSCVKPTSEATCDTKQAVPEVACDAKLCTARDMLRISPRAAKERKPPFWDYSCLTGTDINFEDCQQLDYFISHSWEDNTVTVPLVSTLKADYDRIVADFNCLADQFAEHNKIAVLLESEQLVIAEMRLRETLDSSSLALGYKHFGMLCSILESLANLLATKDILDKNEPLLREVLEVQKRKNEPLLKEFLEDQKRMRGIVFQDVLKVSSWSNEQRQTMSDLAQSMSNLANLLEAQGNLNEADKLYRDELAIKRRMLGDDDPKTLEAVTNLAKLLSTLGKLRDSDVEALHPKITSIDLAGSDCRALTGDLILSPVLQSKIEQLEKLFAQKVSIWFDQACIVKGKVCPAGCDVEAKKQLLDDCPVCKPEQKTKMICRDCKKDKKGCDTQSMAFSTLPIAVGNCETLLVMLSPSYLNRLWCIMELYSVFAFAIPEVSVARINVVRLPGPTLLSKEEELEEFKRGIASWSLDQAHCFDPNEEFRIRQVAFAIGEEEIKKCVRALPSCSFVQLDSPPWWRRWPLPELRKGFRRLLQWLTCSQADPANAASAEAAAVTAPSASEFSATTASASEAFAMAASTGQSHATREGELAMPLLQNP